MITNLFSFIIITKLFDMLYIKIIPLFLIIYCTINLCSCLENSLKQLIAWKTSHGIQNRNSNTGLIEDFFQWFKQMLGFIFGKSDSFEEDLSRKICEYTPTLKSTNSN